jgi:hypothetical protein
MPRRRQLLAAGLLSVTVLAAPAEALSSAVPAQAAWPHSPAALSVARVFLPAITRNVVAAGDVAITGVEVVQGVDMDDRYTVYVAGRPAWLRVALAVSGDGPWDGLSARLTLYADDEPIAILVTEPITLAANATPADLNQALHFSVPGQWLTVGNSYVVELDPANTLAETDETNNRYPATGTQAFDLTSLAPLEVVIVPVVYQGKPPPLDDLSYLTWMPERVLPLAQITYTVRPLPYVFSGDLGTAGGWSALLAAIDAIRAAEDPTWNKLYYGLVDTAGVTACAAGCYTGLGYVNSAGRTVYKTSVGFAGYPSNRQVASQTFTHEMGHNFGRRHAPCAGPSNVDNAYPYAGAAIGQWGYDLASGELKSPGFKDYMSYCGPEWTSDYTYYGIAQAWGWLNGTASDWSAAASGYPLIVSGTLGSDGRLQVDPVFRAAPGPRTLPATGTHRLELLNAQGDALASVPFELAEVILDDARGGHDARAFAFRVAAPTIAGVAGFRLLAGDRLLYERLATGPAPALTFAHDGPGRGAPAGQRVRWALASESSALYRVRYSPDGGANWHLLVHAGLTPSVMVPAQLLSGAPAPLLEVQASDGVRGDTLTIPLDVPVD